MTIEQSGRPVEAAPHLTSGRARLGSLSWKLVVGGSLLAVLAIVAVFAPLFATHEPNSINLRDTLSGPSAEHFFGTDDLGRDVFSRVVYGARLSLGVGVASVALAAVIGSLLGLLSGFWSGFVGGVVMRLMDAMLSIPALLVAIGITAAMGAGLTNVVIAITVVYIPAFARLAYGQVLSLREQEYVLASWVLGAGSLRLLFRHILPNALGPIIVLGALRMSTAILAEASLSFLGLGAQPPMASWGSMVSAGRRYLEIAPWLAGASGAAIALTVIAVSMFGDGFRDVLDPRSRLDR
jgi:peptide/nickel transport system permease protein